jgi:hypothetical protein
MPRWPTSLAPRHGGTAAAVWNGKPNRARENIDRLQAWGYAAEWITLCQVQELEPDIDPETIGDAPVAFFRWSRGARRSPVLS